MRGRVKWFSRKLGWGFIVSTNDKKEYFVHHTNIKSEGYRDLKQGAQVEFEPSTNAKGDLATEVVQLREPKKEHSHASPGGDSAAGHTMDGGAE